MLFSSLTFLCVFFPAFFVCYYSALIIGRKQSLRKNKKPSTVACNTVLLIFSLIFYAWGEIVYIWLLLISIGVNYTLARIIDKQNSSSDSPGHKMRTFFLVISLIFNLGMLAVFKYSGLFIKTINSVFSTDIGVPGISLPIGISFFTFQIMSYVIDVYKQKLRAQKNIFIVAVYLCAFPQLIAGPIVRYSDIELQLAERSVSSEKIAAGLRRFIYGLSKKILIANTVAAVADGIFSYSPEEFGVIGAWIAATAYSLQIYFDFSGYSDMAIGMGKMMGFEYLENFNYPYSARSVTDFWRRWHISLSSFFRDYIYIPLGGNRVTTVRWIFNMLIVWSLTGLWHGASYNFIIWGAYYGILLICEKKLYGKFIEKHRIISRIYTVLAFVVGWVIFWVESISVLGKTLFAMLGGYGTGRGSVSVFTILKRVDCGTYFIIITVIAIILSLAPLKGRFPSLRRYILSRDNSENLNIPTSKSKNYFIIICDIVCVSLLLISIIELEAGSYNPFIYFRF